MPSAIKPCPFCGGVHVFCHENLGWTGNSAQVVCPDCGASSKMIFDNSAKKARNEAVKRWNLRAQT